MKFTQRAYTFQVCGRQGEDMETASDIFLDELKRLHGSLAGGGTFLEWDLVGKGGNYSGGRGGGRRVASGEWRVAGGAFRGGIPAPSAAPSNGAGVDVEDCFTPYVHTV